MLSTEYGKWARHDVFLQNRQDAKSEQETPYDWGKP